MSSSQHALSIYMATSRINSAVKAALAIDHSYTNPHVTAVKSCALRDMMMENVCSSLVMSFIRAQASALKNGP